MWGNSPNLLEQIEPKGMEHSTCFWTLKKKLEPEGLFDPAHKIRLPRLPEKMGRVTLHLRRKQG
jgi:exodeoxyribonuclease VII large subunit